MQDHLFAVGIMVGSKIITALILIASGTTYGVCFRTILAALILIVGGYAMDYLSLRIFFGPETFSKYYDEIEKEIEEQISREDD